MVFIAKSGLRIISGPLGAGKTTLQAALLRSCPNSRPLKRVTTRSQRPTDVEGDYLYVSEKEFREFEEKGLFFSSIKVRNIYHAVLCETLNAALTEDIVTITELAPKMIEQIDAFAKSIGRKIQCVYLDLENEDEARKRLRERGELDIEGRIAYSRDYRKQVLSSRVAYHLIDARASREEVLRQALEYFTST